MHRSGLLAAALVASMAAGAFAQASKLSIKVGGKTRSCNVYVPTGVTKPPVVFFMHGANGSGPAFETETKGDVTAAKGGFIALYPSATSDGTTGTWADMSGTSDFPFYLAVLDTMDARYKIDRSRVYMTGFSQGGFISFVAACSYSDVFAAVAPVSGHAGTSCTLKRPVPMFMTFGALEGAASFLKDRDLWLKWDKCPATETLTKPYPASNPNSKAVRAAYGPCDQGSQVIVDSIIQQQHQWPSASNLVQADEVWNFFKQFSLSATSAVHPEKRAAGAEPFSASYAAGVVTLGGVGENARVRITDTKGQRVAVAGLENGRFSFKNKPSGVYMVTVTGSAGSLVSKFIVP